MVMYNEGGATTAVPSRHERTRRTCKGHPLTLRWPPPSARTALSARELKDKVRHLFGQRAYWTRAELVAQVGNAGMIGATLEELCVRITQKGLHYGEYTLKPEFKDIVAAIAEAKK